MDTHPVKLKSCFVSIPREREDNTMTQETKGLYLTEQQLQTMLDMIKKSIGFDEFDSPDYTDEGLMQYFKDRAVVYNIIEELLS
tara:strand:- start:111 stop:362 length:252 start_codon:yes stop_codon:yes gene_type:complete